MNFADEATGDVFHGRNSRQARKIPMDVWESARRKMDRLNGAVRPEDLKDPPSNRLEKLKGSLKDFYSIRINAQFRLVFRFEEGAASEVRIMDYHG